MRYRGGRAGHHIFRGVGKICENSEHEDNLADADRENEKTKGAT